MSAKFFPREAGRPRKLRRMKTPLSIALPPSAPPPNPVARALVARGATGAGSHIRSHAAQRRADRMALQKAVRQADLRNND